ncbi:MAG: VOC family protein [Alphaproteobacteria bacterium]|nr:VOC family protein [Alphaproteobacteria bacterium]MCZ6741232.1 VOC family protein [Alphaproteobacteria bacterium]MCZ6814091.1 VOC family protein [Alphaproteobacteria bacterium]
MAKLRHIAMSVPDPDKTAEFYCEAFDMERVGTTDSSLATGVFVTDGVITVALLKFKTDESAGYVEGEDERGKDFVGLHHIGFKVDELREAEIKIEEAGGKYFMGRPTGDAPTSFYEEKFRDPNGVIIDVSHLGWEHRHKI